MLEIRTPKTNPNDFTIKCPICYMRFKPINGMAVCPSCYIKAAHPADIFWIASSRVYYHYLTGKANGN